SYFGRYEVRGAGEKGVIEGNTALGGGGAMALSGATFREVLGYVMPRPEELRWQGIPWLTDLWAARRLALEAGKPIFLWTMNGNPLGCT
ncbi:MAG: hypothetical protein M3442_22065, partial [Chloroflexota bacterium]|nr:hypothetical protein [Chloroflexota bacterium]